MFRWRPDKGAGGAEGMQQVKSVVTALPITKGIYVPISLVDILFCFSKQNCEFCELWLLLHSIDAGACAM